MYIKYTYNVYNLLQISVYVLPHQQIYYFIAYVTPSQILKILKQSAKNHITQKPNKCKRNYWKILFCLRERNYVVKVILYLLKFNMPFFGNLTL